MLKNYVKIAWRNLKASKFYSIVNVSGLAVGLATGIMLLLWVQNECSYDKFNQQYKNIYQLNSHITLENKSLAWQGAPGPLAIMSKKIPDVISVLRLVSDNENPTLSNHILSNVDQTKVFDNNSIVYTESNFLSFFDYKLLKGNRYTFLPNASSVALTQSTAKKLFGADDPIGKIVRFDKNNFTVTAVLQDFPHNSSLQYDAIFPVDYYAQQFTAHGGNHGWKTIDEDVNDYSFRTFLLLRPNANTSTIETKLTHLFNGMKNGQALTTFQLQNLGDLHLTGIDGDNSALQMVRIMALVAILILIIASINYVNLSTARALTRIKEVSIKKIIGAKRRQLFLQFITETVLTFGFAIFIAIALIVLLKPLYDRITGEQLILSLSNFSILEIWFFVLLGTILISGIYPAMLLSSFNPLGAVRDKSFLGIKTSSFRKSLVILQFAISFILLVESQYKKYASNAPFSYDFFDKTFESHYQSQQHTGTLFTTFAAIAIFISCLGLFGLATYTAQVKTKEIGIRKVLGASVGTVVQLISKDFLKLVIIATVIATPLAYWAMNKWLQGFAYRIHISGWTFVLAAVISIVIALIAISSQSIKAAMANPVDSLRNE